MFDWDLVFTGFGGRDEVKNRLDLDLVLDEEDRLDIFCFFFRGLYILEEFKLDENFCRFNFGL